MCFEMRRIKTEIGISCIRIYIWCKQVDNTYMLLFNFNGLSLFGLLSISIGISGSLYEKKVHKLKVTKSVVWTELWALWMIYLSISWAMRVHGELLLILIILVYECIRVQTISVRWYKNSRWEVVFKDTIFTSEDILLLSQCSLCFIQ